MSAPDWRQRGTLWCLTPNRAVGVVEMIGGSYLAATPHLSYRRLLEALAEQDWAVRAWSYVPGFDHQAQATDAWRSFRRQRAQDRDRGRLPADLPVLRLGHSLGCKLHLLAPDGGRACCGVVAMSFNNFSADRSIPLLGELAPRLQFTTEFSPGPQETLRLIRQSHLCPRNLLIRFGEDALDQSPALLDCLQDRPDDASRLLQLPGDHLSPASAGFRRQVLGAWADDPARGRSLRQLAATISQTALAWIGRPQPSTVG
ncbi:DUF1350 domain-containing protein [Synechococcus sp. RSCCF101]|uniref:DUF1350 family protein n=1 Tax=Synechococcus sp. RSCCF101 TaxID=2511069 RepID=UPI0012442F09|nr:DUF1350 family protein [Synechococcus sp. RSCCF101]QEY31466.1 DUF1350 domain-containing protein [Synechococcus sp. RSCCF101]